MDHPILSICIPTYNRAECLRQCLESITSQFSDPEVFRQVQIVLSDNASADNTAEVADFFCRKFSNVIYVKNEQNVGYDSNVLRVIAKAQGDYVWLLGDDDGLFAGSLKYILPFLIKQDFDYFLANGWGYDKKLLNKAVNQPYFNLSKNLQFARLADYIKSITNYKQLVGNFGGMSGQIFKRQVWRDFSNKESFIGSQIIHLLVILSAFKNLPSCVIAQPMYMARSDNVRWEITPGFESLTKRTKASYETLVWILNEYSIPYSIVWLKMMFASEAVNNVARVLFRQYIFKSQKSRDMVKKALGKL